MSISSRLLLPALLACASLVACSDNDGMGASPIPVTTTATITPSLGRVSDARVEVRCLQDDRLMGSGPAGADGRATLSLSGDCTGPLLLQLIPGAAGLYYDESLATQVALPADTRLRSLVTGFRRGTAFAAAITPLTEIATSRALAVAGTGQVPTAAQISAAAAAVTVALFGSGSEFDPQSTPRLWDAGLAAGSLDNNTADRYAFYLATLAALGSGANPAVSVTHALAEDLADGELDGAEAAGFTYTSAQFETLRSDAYRELAPFATAELRTALEIPDEDEEEGETTFPNENIVLPAQRRPALGQPGDIRAEELSSMVGHYTGIATLYRSQGSVDTAGTNCTVDVGSDGNLRVTVGDFSIAQAVVGTTSSQISPQPNYAGSWNLEAVGAPGRDVSSVQIEVRRNKLTYAQATVVNDTSQVPPQIQKSIRCWMVDNRAPGTAGDRWNSTSAANASDINAVVLGTYTGPLFSNNGVLGKSGETCRVSALSDGRLQFATLGTSSPVTLDAMIAGDHNDQVVETDANGEWSLLARDYPDRTTNTYVSIQLRRVNGMVTVTANRVVGNQLSGWACNGMNLTNSR